MCRRRTGARLTMAVPAQYFGFPLLGWEAYVGLGIAGYGMAVLRALRVRASGAGMTLCTGVAVWISMGGWLNLVQHASAMVIRGLLGLGVAYLCVRAIRVWRDHGTVRGRATGEALRELRPERAFARRGLWLAGGVIGCYLLLCFAVHLLSFSWNKWDDVQAYMAFAEKASALGGVQAEPFSERRLTSSVGGSIFLHATMLAGAGLPSLDFLDGALGFLALLFCLVRAARRFGLRGWQVLAVLYGAAVFTLSRVNLTILNFSAALFLAVLLLLLTPEQDDRLPWREAGLLGLWCGASFTLKSNNIPFCALFLGLIFAGWCVRRRSLRPLLGAVPVLGVSAAVFVPWALRQRIDEHTALFPLLGRGYHLSAYGWPTIAQTVPVPVSLLASLNGVLLPLGAGLFCWYLLRSVPGVPRWPLLAFFAAATLTAPLFAVSIAAENLNRFLLPVQNVCALLFLITLLAAAKNGARWTVLVPATAFLGWWTVLFVHLGIAKESYFRDPVDVAALFVGAAPVRDALQVYETVLTPPDLAAATAEVRRAQQAIPPGATVLENVEAAYGFDWRRNRVLVADYPGMASPPPGLPLLGSPEQMRMQLQADGVQYVVLDRRLMRHTDFAEFVRQPQIVEPWAAMLNLWDPPEIAGYSRMEDRTSNHTRELLMGMEPRAPKVYDDGRLLVLALQGEAP